MALHSTEARNVNPTALVIIAMPASDPLMSVPIIIEAACMHRPSQQLLMGIGIPIMVTCVGRRKGLQVVLRMDTVHCTRR